MVVPADWKEVSFDEAFARVNISSRKLQTSEFKDFGKLPVVDQGQSKISGFSDRIDLEMVPPQDGFVIFGDHTRIVKHVGHSFVVGADGVQVLRSRDGFNARFLSLLLASSKIPNTGYNRHFKFLRDLTFQCPSNQVEQEVIAEALSDADAAIESLDALITKKRDVKQATMQQLLTGRTRLPGFTADWNEVRLGDLGTCLRGVSYKGDSDLSDGDTPTTVRLLRSNNVQNSLIQFHDVQYVNHDCVSDEQILRRDDIVICMANGSKVLVGKTGLYKDSQDTRYTFGAFMACFRSSSDQAHAIFVRYLFLTKQYQDYISNLLAGSSINNLTPKSIESLLFNVPPLKEQEAIAETLTVMDDELEALTEQVSKLRMVKEGMMQDLLTGKVRLV